MRRSAAAVLCALVLASAPARAIDLSVSYLADAKAAQALETTTPLTFALHGDAGCTQPLETATIAAGDTLLERVRTVRLRGAPKSPKAVRLHDVLADVPAAPAYYLQVTGAGIAPLGGSCQAQGGGQPAAAAVPCLTQEGSDVFFTGCNVHVRNGTGGTFYTNGLGNLIVGYNEAPAFETVGRTGSHNLVVGYQHQYDTYASLIAGDSHTVRGPRSMVSGTHHFVDIPGGIEVGATVLGGSEHRVTANGGSVFGGYASVVEGAYGTVVGGQFNGALGAYGTVTGGTVNGALGEAATVAGGAFNSASGPGDAISGGRENTTFGPYASVSAGTRNFAVGDGASVSGGHCNRAGASPAFPECSLDGIGTGASVAGGIANQGLGIATSVTGGWGNVANGHSTSVCGGRNNTADGFYTAVSGGQARTAAGHDDWVAGSLFEDF